VVLEIQLVMIAVTIADITLKRNCCRKIVTVLVAVVVNVIAVCILCLQLQLRAKIAKHLQSITIGAKLLRDWNYYNLISP
jgi:hypothetical protein